MCGGGVFLVPAWGARAFGDGFPALQIQAPTPMNIFAANKEKGKTFRPRRNHREGTKRYQLHKFAQVCSRPDCGLCFVCVCVCRGCREGNAHRVGAAARRPRSARATFTRL